MVLLSCATNEVPLYVGTYTDEKSEGIYQLKFNMETGELGDPTVAFKTENPSFLAYGPNKNFLYAVGETNDFEGLESGYVSAYKILENGHLQLLNQVSSQGAHPCHIAIDPNGNKAVVSNYTGGTVALYHILSNGSLSKAYQVFDHNIENEVSHAHSAQFFKDRLYVADLGKNAVFEYQLVKENFELVTPSIVNMTENGGPRHFSLSKNGDFIYIINEYANTVTSAVRKDKGFQFLAHDSTLDDSFKGESYCADIHLSKDESFLYGSNRGENSIVVFKRNSANGGLQKIQTIGVEGNWPRNFTLAPNGKYLLVANQKSKNISVYSVNKSSGMLHFLYSTEFPTPVCLLF
jgi:6-phosphogluconolactonase